MHSIVRLLLLANSGQTTIKCRPIKELFGYARCDNMSGILIELAATIAHNYRVLFAVIARYHAVRSFSSSQTLLCGNFILSVVFFSLVLVRF